MDKILINNICGEVACGVEWLNERGKMKSVSELTSAKSKSEISSQI